MQAFGNGKYHVGFVGPEMSLNEWFHKLVIENETFLDNIISVVIDESHNISKWGTDDFHPDFAHISALLGYLPQGLPIMAASATVPPEVITHIKDKLGIGGCCEHIAVSNEKLNVSLAVQIMQHPPNSFANLLSLFPRIQCAQKTLNRHSYMSTAAKMLNESKISCMNMLPSQFLMFNLSFTIDTLLMTIKSLLKMGSQVDFYVQYQLLML